MNKFVYTFFSYFPASNPFAILCLYVCACGRTGCLNRRSVKHRQSVFHYSFTEIESNWIKSDLFEHVHKCTTAILSLWRVGHFERENTTETIYFSRFTTYVALHLRQTSTSETLCTQVMSFGSDFHFQYATMTHRKFEMKANERRRKCS